MSFALIQNHGNSNTSSATTSLTTAFLSNNTAGNFLVAFFRVPSGAATTLVVTDSQSNVWHQYLSTVTTIGGDKLDLWYAMNCKSGANSVTASQVGGAAFFLRMIIAEFSGVSLTSALDTSISTGNLATSPNPISGFIQPTTTDLLLGFCANSTIDSLTMVSTAAWTLIQNETGNLNAFYQTLPDTPPTSFQGTQNSASSQQYTGSITALQAASGGTAMPAFVRAYVYAQGTASATTVTSTNVLTAGDVGIITVLWNNVTVTVSSVHDSAGNTWTAVANTLQQNTSLGTGYSQQTYVAPITTGGASVVITLTLSATNANNFPTITGAEFSGINTTTPVTASNSQKGNAVPVSPVLSGISPANFMLWSFLETNNGNTQAGAGWEQIEVTGSTYYMPMYQAVIAGKYQFASTYNQSVAWGASIAGFKAPSFGVANSLMMMGVGI